MWGWFLLLSAYSLVSAYDNTGVWLSGAAYCDRVDYPSMVLGGPAKGFVYKDTLHDPATDVQGYIGILPSQSTIYIVLRGSSSLLNWLDDIEVKLVPYPLCNNPCKVHYGFYRSAMGIRNHTIDVVRRLHKEYPSYGIVVTGHSYGAAVGQLLAMELVYGLQYTVKLYNYGQPRVGDPVYAKLVNDRIAEFGRVTHNKDMVPHVPPIDGFGYRHSAGEVFEDAGGLVHLCSETNGEDPKCADQFALYQTGTSDHEIYLGKTLTC